jgi:hypothetical protein
MLVATLISTKVAVWFYNERPHKMLLSDDHLEAQLLSWSKRELFSWSAKPPGKISFAELVERPAVLGGGQLAVVGFNQHHPESFRGALCAFDAAHAAEKPVWRRRIETEEIIPALRSIGYVGEEFGVSHGLIADIFEESVGPEIVAAYQHTPYSACVIRVYDLRGTVLYEMWQDGGVTRPYWMSGAGLLVFSAENSEASWDERGRPGERLPFPWVVFGVRPKLGFVSKEFMGSVPGEGPLELIFYKCPLPQTVGEFSAAVSVSGPARSHDPGRFVQVHLDFGGLVATGLSWTLDDNGDVVPGTRVVSSNYMRAFKQGILPDPKVFHLGTLPPIVTQKIGD